MTLDDLSSQLFGQQPVPGGAQPQQGGLLGLLGGNSNLQSQGGGGLGQLAQSLLAAPQQLRPPPTIGGGSFGGPRVQAQPFAPQIPGAPVPAFSQLAQLRQSLGLPPVQQATAPSLQDLIMQRAMMGQMS